MNTNKSQLCQHNNIVIPRTNQSSCIPNVSMKITLYFQWSIPVPSCLAPCIIPQIEQGVASEAVGEKVTHGDQIYVNCTDNYEVNVNSFNNEM